MAKIEGGSLDWQGDKFFLLATKETVKGTKEASIYLQGVVKQMVGGVGTGRRYKRTKSGKYHTASSPGKPPARDSGIYASSISYEVMVKSGIVRGFVGPDVDKIKRKRPNTTPKYGLYLELGTKRMAARPHLKRALIKSTPKIYSILRNRLK